MQFLRKRRVHNKICIVLKYRAHVCSKTIEKLQFRRCFMWSHCFERVCSLLYLMQTWTWFDILCGRNRFRIINAIKTIDPNHSVRFSSFDCFIEISNRTLESVECKPWFRSLTFNLNIFNNLRTNWSRSKIE